MKLGVRTIAVLFLTASSCCEAFRPPLPLRTRSSSRGIHSSQQLYANVRDASSLMQEMRAELAKDEDVYLMMQALRGQNLNDDDVAVEGLQMQLVDIAPRDNDSLPYEYDPVALKAFFSSRPMALVTRLLQLGTVGSKFLFNTLLDRLLGRIQQNPDLEVQRAAELRDLLTSLGPFYIKIGQALSIRPDILSPRSMVELQKLCDKVPSFDSKIAFATIEKELGKPVEEIFSSITPTPVAAASLGQGKFPGFC